MTTTAVPQPQDTVARQTKPDRRLVIAAVMLAMAVRLAAMWWLRTWEFARIFGAPAGDTFPFGFEAGSIAHSLATGHGFGSPFRDAITGPSAWIAPIYPTMIALIFKVFGLFSKAAAIPAITLNSLFSALTCWPIYEVGRRTVGRRVALWSVFLWAVCPLFWRWPITWIWEISLSALLFTCAFWFALRLREGAGRRDWILFGLFWGVCALINPSLLVFSVVSALWAAWPQLGSLGGWLRTAILAGFVAVLTISPWLVRNRLVLGEWVFIRDNFGFELELGNYQGSNAMGWGGRHPEVNDPMFAEYKQFGEVQFVARHGARARQFILQNPGEFLAMTGDRFVAFWDGEAALYTAHEWWQPWMFWPLSALALLGAIFAITRDVTGAWMYFWGILLYPLPYYITYPQTRYRHAVEPLMLLLSVYFFAFLGNEIRGLRRTGKQTE